MTTKRLSIAGNLPMSRAEAQALIDNGHGVVLHLWGEGPYKARISATATGLAYRKELLLMGNGPLDDRPDVKAYLIES
jgi:hypothetical protein